MNAASYPAARMALALFLTCSMLTGLSACSGSGKQMPPDPADLQPIRLLEPKIKNDGSLMHLLKERESIRLYDEERELPESGIYQVSGLADVLYRCIAADK